MRLKLRIILEREGRRLKKEDFKGKEPLSLAFRYICEFKYLEASKFLQLAPDCYEKFYLLYLINLALGQEELASEYYKLWENYPRKTDLDIKVRGSEEI